MSQFSTSAKAQAYLISPCQKTLIKLVLSRFDLYDQISFFAVHCVCEGIFSMEVVLFQIVQFYIVVRSL